MGGVTYWYNWLLSKLVITYKAALDAQDVSMCHLQPKAGDPANVDFIQRKTDWIPVRSTRMTEIIFLPNKGGSGWGETPLLKSVAHSIRTASFFPNRGRKISLHRDENDNKNISSLYRGRIKVGASPKGGNPC